ncbi:acyltransferase family protein [Thomasclavelia cocleata]|uniref:acyltransferase family protein n=1 Tax=Thomasclavelia cocleata TaxID=69824 RepID=UPI0025843065|nr:acyltransferase [Thomasclavelia cocleata]
MKERNKNIDIVRSGALLLVLVYHFWVLSGSIAHTNILFIDQFIKLGGEIGVTVFFILSGYGIYWSIDNAKSNGDFNYKRYMIKRLKRIVPEYYVCFILVLLLTDNAGYLYKDQFQNIWMHFLFIHNLSPDFASSINGVLWTMGVIFQFYLIAPLLYKVIKKQPYIILLISFIFTCICKAIVYKFILYNNGLEAYSFYAGRQLLPTVLDNFITGMFLAYIIKNKKIKVYNHKRYILLLSTIIIFIIVYKMGLKYGIHSNNISGYIWHSVLALSLGSLIYAFSTIKINMRNIGIRIILWIAKHEYSIYLWHLIVTINLINKAPIVSSLINKGGYILLFAVLLIITILVGYLFSILLHNSKFTQIFDKVDEKYIN